MYGDDEDGFAIQNFYDEAFKLCNGCKMNDVVQLKKN